MVGGGETVFVICLNYGVWTMRCGHDFDDTREKHEASWLRLACT
jgi:hypothetical protein